MGFLPGGGIPCFWLVFLSMRPHLADAYFRWQFVLSSRRFPLEHRPLLYQKSKENTKKQNEQKRAK